MVINRVCERKRADSVASTSFTETLVSSGSLGSKDNECRRGSVRLASDTQSLSLFFVDQGLYV